MSLITSSTILRETCERLAQHPYVTVDTEFLRETTFWPKVCVVQLASEDEAVAIDTLAEDIDLGPFYELMANEDVVKVFHAARQDIEIIWRGGRLIPAPLFDTQVAAMVCGFGDQVSYQELVSSICRLSVDKSSRFTDWSRRPLSEAQISYALADVTHLRTIYATLKARVEKAGRESWLADEMSILTSPATYEQLPEDAWQRFRNRVRKPRDLAVLMEVAAWREREAQSRDVPRSRVLKDDSLVEIALTAPTSVDALGQLRSLPRGMERSRSATDMISAVERGLQRDPKSLPKIQREKRGNGNTGATVELLKVLLRQVSERHQVAAKMIATVDDLEAIAADDKADVAALSGWRRRIFGEKALELKHGKLALTMEKGRVVTLEWQDLQPEEAQVA
ncbi:MAG: ribonuclease D [Beijerinckiaceae bacterium]